MDRSRARTTGALALLGAGVLFVVLARASGDPPEPAPDRPAAALDPALSQRLEALPDTEPVRLLVTVAAGSPTEVLRRDVERLGGRLVERFTLIDAVVVVVPAGGVQALAELPQVVRVEPADGGEPPPVAAAVPDA
jgi:hypothetical protein